MMVTVRRVVWVLAAALCCTALCVTAAEEGMGGSVSEEADLEKQQDTSETTRIWECTAEDAQTAVKEAEEAVRKAKEAVKEAKANAKAGHDAVYNLLAVSQRLRDVGLAVNQIQLPYNGPWPPKEKEEVNKLNENITKMLGNAVEIKSKADTHMQAARISETEADEAVQHIGLVEANCRVPDRSVKDAVSAAKATAAAVKKALFYCSYEAQKEYNASVRLHDTAGRLVVAGKELFDVVDKMTKNDALWRSKLLSDLKVKSWNIDSGVIWALDKFTSVMSNADEAVKGAEDALIPIVVTQETAASEESVLAGPTPEAALGKADVRQPGETEGAKGRLVEGELEKLAGAGGLHRPQQPEVRPANQEGGPYEQSSTAGGTPATDAEVTSAAHSSATETATAREPVLNGGNMAENERLLSNFPDGSSDIPARVRAPLMLLLLACVAVW
ncbi:hypothetical protein DQ04_08931010 [Trypanosoma grayi]|uniref:hypothetical protein n=1 Tax=Trypanosoma grayi TaxID=71804 RepID=UPI0004F44DEA|nr:hypothetical protein DQ04_08931010 [Trypanosoma grayi]KEG07740.1 hypothetical protein DQ04_08931010 [Trypanosoma grayi]